MKCSSQRCVTELVGYLPRGVAYRLWVFICPVVAYIYIFTDWLDCRAVRTRTSYKEATIGGYEPAL